MKGKRRWIELGKDVLILLLTVSAVWLLAMTPLVQDSGVLDLLAPRESPGTGSSAGSGGAAMLPARLVISGEEGRLGVQYDDARVEELFPPLGALLGDALASAGQAQAITQAAWQRYLSGRSVYFDFAGEVPLTVLERWLQGSGTCGLTGSARRLLLCAGEGDQVLLCWQEDGTSYSCSTALTQALHLDPAVEAAAFNGAYFAYERPELSRWLDPCTLITEGEQAGTCYAVSNPLTGEKEVAAVLAALSFSGQNHAPVSGGELFLDGGDRLVVGSGGTVTYRAVQPEKYPVGAPEGEDDFTAAVERTRALAEAALGTLCGEARPYLMSVQEAGGALRVRYGCLLNGSAVYLGAEGWAAEFWVRGGYIAEFTLRFRSYAANGERTLLLPVDKAAAMLPDLSAERRELVIQYRDGGGQTVSPNWEAV